MKSKRKYYFIGFGIVLLALAAFLLYFLAPVYLDSFFLFAVGCILCGSAVSLVISTYRCKEKVTAVLTDYGFEQFKAHVTSHPTFTYQYERRIYTTTAAESFSQRYILKNFKKGEAYAIYVSPQNPSFIKIRRQIRIFDILLFSFGLAAIVFSIVSVFLIGF